MAQSPPLLRVECRAEKLPFDAKKPQNNKNKKNPPWIMFLGFLVFFCLVIFNACGGERGTGEGEQRGEGAGGWRGLNGAQGAVLPPL